MGRPRKVDWEEVNKREAVDHVRKFYQTSYNWRNQGYHAKWDKWDRNFHNIYDPTNKAKKEPWQATMFIPLTVSVLETIASALVKILLGGDRVITVEPREMGDRLQAELRMNLLDYEIDQSGFHSAVSGAVREALRYGSGFVKMYWKKTLEKRRIQEPVRAGFSEANKLGLEPGTISGYEEKTKDVYVEDHAQLECVHIRDIFPEPNSRDLKRVIHRNKTSYAELLEMAQIGAFDKKEVQKLRDVHENDNFETDVMTLKGERDITDPTLQRPTFDKNHTIWEYWGLIPRKWIELGMDGTTDKANEVIPGKIMVASGDYYLGSEENPLQFMKPPFFKVDYIDTGDTYGKGAAQIMEGLQDEVNEIRNQRVDNVNLIMNKMFAVLEKNLVDGRIVSMPGGMVRIRSGGSANVDDVRKALMPIEVPDVALSAYKETIEIERQVQEATGANRVTTGTAGLVNDQNQTLGGMQLLRQAAFDRFTVTAFFMGKQFLVPLGKALFCLVYQNRGPEQIKRILGEMPLEILPGQIIPKWQSYRPLPPHEVDQFYDFKVVDVFGKENKAQKAGSVMTYLQTAAGMLQTLNPKPGLEEVGNLLDLDEETVFKILGPDVGPSQSPLAQGLGQPSLAKQGGKSGPSSPSGPPTAVPTGPPQQVGGFNGA